MANYPTSLPSTNPATHGEVDDEIVAIATALGVEMVNVGVDEDDRGAAGPIANMPRWPWVLQSVVNMSQAGTFGTWLTAPRSGTFTQMRGATGGTAAVTVTSAGMACYGVDKSTGALTKLGGVIDTALWIAANTTYIRTLDTSVVVTRGDRLCFIAHCAATTLPTLIGSSVVYNSGHVRSTGGLAVGSGAYRMMGAGPAVSGSWPASYTDAQFIGFSAGIGQPYLELVP